MLSAQDGSSAPGELYIGAASNPTHEADVAPSNDASYCHVYVPPPLPAVFRLLRLFDDSPLANAKALVRCPDGTIVQGTTDGQGTVRVYGGPSDFFTLVQVVDPDVDQGHELVTHDAPVALDAESTPTSQSPA